MRCTDSRELHAERTAGFFRASLLTGSDFSRSKKGRSFGRDALRQARANASPVNGLLHIPTGISPANGLRQNPTPPDRYVSLLVGAPSGANASCEPAETIARKRAPTKNRRGQAENVPLFVGAPSGANASCKTAETIARKRAPTKSDEGIACKRAATKTDAVRLKMSRSS
jgi:hypothetical protein